VCNSARCSIEAQAFGGNDYSFLRYAYVKLNGVAVWRASWWGEYPVHRGVNVIIVDLSTCIRQAWHSFDTYGDSTAAVRLHDYLQGLSDGTVLVGVSCESTEWGHNHLQYVFPTLRALGADVADVRYRGAFVFVAVKGDSSKTVLDRMRAEALNANATMPHVNTNFCKCD